uniref:Uncharacterized protein n=1 Tax=Bactrocera dorsalis TaxID=27457 RepID=A0A034W7X9_BACDO
MTRDDIKEHLKLAESRLSEETEILLKSTQQISGSNFEKLRFEKSTVPSNKNGNDGNIFANTGIKGVGDDEISHQAAIIEFHQTEAFSEVKRKTAQQCNNYYEKE